MAWIEKRELQRRDSNGHMRAITRYKVRYPDPAGTLHGETFRRRVDAERWKAEIEIELANNRWRHPRRGEIRLTVWASEWIKTRHDLRATTRARLETTMKMQVLPAFGPVPLIKITNAAIRSWVASMISAGRSPATVRKAVFALRKCLSAAVADYRIAYNPALEVPLPAERMKQPRFLSQSEVEGLVEAMGDK
jgi:hypothetical protein